MIELDSSEGGGQMLRYALSLSAITGKAFTMKNIRGNRPNPGLQWQHLVGALSVRKISRGKLEGAKIKSQTLTYIPSGLIIGGRYEFVLPTAGSVTLLLQTLLPILVFANKKSKLKLIGGTDVPFSPTWDYLKEVLLPTLKLWFSIEVEAKLIKRGFYPKGGGEVEVEITPKFEKGKPISLETGWNGRIVLCNLPKNIFQREKKVLVEALDLPLSSVKLSNYGCGKEPGNSITLWNGTHGASSVGIKGKRAEDAAQECVEAAKECTGRDVDSHLGDQLMIFSALSVWKFGEEIEYSVPKITNHMINAKTVLEAFLPVKVELSNYRVRITPEK